ncbi:MAG TPA: efflux RND transporter periplasmic adaptor subunit [Planktothrix sp.]
MREMKSVVCGLAGVMLALSALTLSSCERQEKTNTDTGIIESGPKPKKGADNAGDTGDVRQIRLSAEAQNEAGIQYGYAEERQLDSAVKVTGEVLANADLQTHVTTPVTGRVTDVLVRVGDKINEGKELIKIRSTDIEQSEADLLQNESQVRADLKQNLLQIDSDTATAEAQIKLSESTFKRISSLVDEKIASRADFETSKTQWEKDKITLDALKRKREATINLAKEKIELITEPTKTKLRLLGVSDEAIVEVLKTRKVDPFVPVLAPESGIISERLVNVGELVDPTKPLFTIGDYHNVWLKADVYEKDVSKVHEGQPIVLEVDSFPNEKFTGRLNYVADSINPDTRTLTVRAEVPNPGLKLKPKMFARMKILVGENRVLTIPTAAVQDAGTSKVVYVPIGGASFEERHIRLGNDYGDEVEVLQGVRPGERVVTKGSFDLRSESLRQS